MADYIVQVGIQGPPGPTDFGKARISRVAGESLDAFVAVAVASDGKVYRASKSTPDHISRVLGITLAAAAVNAAVDVHLFGEVTNGAWTFDTTKLIYLGDDGALAQSAPTAGFVLVLGFPTSASSMFVVPGVGAILASAGTGDAGRAVALDSTGKVALSFLPATLAGKDADTVDGYHAGNAAGKVPILDGSALLPLAQVPETLTGKAADTVDGYHASALAKAGANSDITSLAGQIGIGTTSPRSRLHVAGGGTVATFGDTTGDVSIEMAKSSNGAAYVPAFNMNSVFDIGPGSGYGVVGTKIKGGGANGLYINSDGNVGIGTTNQFGGGAGVLAIANASSVPGSNPAGGVVVYADPADGKLKYRSASGEVRTLNYTV